MTAQDAPTPPLGVDRQAALTDFFANHLPSKGVIKIAQRLPTGWRHFECRSAEDAARRALELDHGGAGDVYVAIATYREAPGRKATNALWVRSLVLDIDVGPDKAAEGKGYASQSEAMDAVVRLINALGVGSPTIVSSGTGLHVWFALTTDIHPADWRGLARLLKAACKKLGLRVDHARTTDVASVMRVPGTWNRKRVEPQPVEVLGHVQSERTRARS